MNESNTLVTFLGKGREDKRRGYRSATYRFPDGTVQETPLFGFALAAYLEVDTLVILGTSGSQWGVLVENLVGEGREEDKILQLMEAEVASEVDQTMLDDVANLMSDVAGRGVLPRLIPFGKDADEQYRILETVANSVPSGRVSFDVTHGFRHLGMVGFQAAFMLERARNLQVDRLWYGALDMTEGGITPVLRLDGLIRAQRWVAALERFDATGDYGVFAPLLAEDGMARRKTDHLKRAAFHERNFNLKDAADSLRRFLPALAHNLSGASGLFQGRLSERLAWIEEPALAAQQRKLAFQYLNRGDFVRAAVLGWEAYITFECTTHGRDPNDFTDKGRKGMVEELHKFFDAGMYPDWKRDAYRKLNAIRNALAHSSVPSDANIRRLLGDEPRLKLELERSIQRIVPAS